MLLRGTKWFEAYHVTALDATEVYNCLQHFASPHEHIGYVYSDAVASIKQACEALSLRHDTATPQVPRTNAIAERQVQETIHGTRVLLSRAGLPAVYWPML